MPASAMAAQQDAPLSFEAVQNKALKDKNLELEDKVRDLEEKLEGIAITGKMQDADKEHYMDQAGIMKLLRRLNRSGMRWWRE